MSACDLYKIHNLAGPRWCLFFFFNDTATTEIYTLSLHDALPISLKSSTRPSESSLRSTPSFAEGSSFDGSSLLIRVTRDRKSTRLNSSHSQISHAVFCL